MKECLLTSPKDYKIISQTGVRQFVFPLDIDHNAIWDSSISPDGTLYFALATELSTAGYVRLYKYNYETNTVDELFRVEDVIMPFDRSIRPSKFHTSIDYMNDGRIVMTTHTTDKAPAHPSWMPVAYFHHLWEGYQGSHIVAYDPATGKAENLGCPIPRESIYGSKYDPKHNALYFMGWIKGHAYRYSFDDHSIIDYGQCSENAAFRFIQDKEGRLYTGTRSGWLYRIDTDTGKIEDLNFRIPYHVYPEYSADYKGLSHGGIGPDGRLYMCFFYSRKIVAFDSTTDTFEVIGDYLPAQKHNINETRNGIFGMDFDSEGVMWYAVFSRNCDSDRLEIGMPSSLFRWDIARGGKPEWMGIIGTKERAACWTSEVNISDDDIMYIIGTNHAVDGPDITAIDLKQYRKDMYNFGNEITEDPYYLENPPERYRKVADYFLNNIKFLEKNKWNIEYDLDYEPIRLWRALAPNHIEDSPVKQLLWTDNNTLKGICGNETDYVFTVSNGELKGILPASENPDDYNMLLNAAEQKTSFTDTPALPHYPGRQYKAEPVAQASIGDKTVIGTLDGMLAVYDGSSVFSLGPAAYNGPVRDMAAMPDGSAVYGVAGDQDDIGILFRYDETSGLKWLGHVSYGAPSDFGPIHCNVLSACAISPDGKTLVVGSGDRLGTLMFYRLP
ncbi:MAG: hypothetical protein ACOYJD_04140 [Christensenellales bacterium]|jgi:WD40 repeat protein